jgi:uncharacterized membrane protein
MAMLITGLAMFFLVHLVPAIPSLRASLVGSLGEGAYKLGFSLLAAIGLVLVAYGYGEARPVAGDLFIPPEWTRHLALLLVLIAFVLLASAYIPSRIRDRARHPMLAAVKIWAFAHLIANGDSASALLFGSFLAYAVYDRISLKRRGNPGLAERAKGTLGGDLGAIAVGVIAWVAMLLWGHEALIGLAPIAPVAIPS